jgi:hypothetical protein
VIRRIILRHWFFAVLILLFTNIALGEDVNSEFYNYANQYFFEYDNFSNAVRLKEVILREAGENRFSGPSHSMKIRQLWGAERGIVYLDLLKRYPKLFDDDERLLIQKWFEGLVKRAFTIEWSDFYYMLTFRKAITAPYRNQENGVAALAIYAEIIEDENPELAKKARRYIADNAILWKSNFRNTDDSISYQASWIYNAWRVGKLMFQETLSNTYSKQSFDWLMKQWPPNGGPLGYNPDLSTIIPDIFFLGAKLHSSPEYRWLGEKSLNFALRNEIELQGLRQGFQFFSEEAPTREPTVGSTYIQAPGNLVQFPSENRPDKIVFRSGWKDESLYALLNLRYDGFHGYKATNAIVSLYYGAPFVVEDLVKISRKWLPRGRARVRDDNIERHRLNGFYIDEPLFNQVFNKIDVLRTRWWQTLPRHTKTNKFYNSDIFDYSRTDIIDWSGWNNYRTCLLVDDSYFAVFDFNKGNSAKQHSIIWHVRGRYNSEQSILTQNNYKLQTAFLFNDNSSISIRSSKEIYEPESVLFEPNYDIVVSSSEDHSEIVTIFAPVKSQTMKVKPVIISEELICVEIHYQGEQDHIIINNNGGFVECNGIKTNASFLLTHDNELYEIN